MLQRTSQRQAAMSQDNPSHEQAQFTSASPRSPWLSGSPGGTPTASPCAGGGIAPLPFRKARPDPPLFPTNSRGGGGVARTRHPAASAACPSAARRGRGSGAAAGPAAPLPGCATQSAPERGAPTGARPAARAGGRACAVRAGLARPAR